MKTKLSTLIAIISLCFSMTTYAQVTMYGLTSGGGAYGVGTVFSITPTGNFNVIANLNSTFAAVPYGSLLYASDGNFYATSMDGGYADSCTVFRCSPNGMLHTMINLDSVWGTSEPQGNSLIQGKDGNLYGMTTMGGPTDSINSQSSGVIFKLQLSGKYSALHFFNDSDGATPYGSLIQTSDGILWGMTSAGGTYGLGTIFKCTTSGIFTSLYSFDDSDGMAPYGDLVLANDGNFYGMTCRGGAYGGGTLFRYTPSGTFTKLVDFTIFNGVFPYGSLIQANDGKLYGMTSGGGDSIGGNNGSIFQCTLSGNIKTIATFNDTINGMTPLGSLMQASDGVLYGMASEGGTYNYGTVFKCSLAGTLTKIFDFDYTRASPLYASLIEVDSLENTAVPAINTISSGVSVYPNPNNGVFNVVCNPQLGSSFNPIIEIYNTLGEKIHSEILNQVKSAINLNEQPAGIYLYRVLDANSNLIGEGKIVLEK